MNTDSAAITITLRLRLRARKDINLLEKADHIGLQGRWEVLVRKEGRIEIFMGLA